MVTLRQDRYLYAVERCQLDDGGSADMTRDGQGLGGIEQKLEPGEHAPKVAGRLTTKIFLIRSDDTTGNFWRPLSGRDYSWKCLC